MDRSIMTVVGIVVGLIAFALLLYFVRMKLYGG
jgi:hypothetical protein